MSEFYWITRLDGICGISIFLLILSIVFTTIFSIICLANHKISIDGDTFEKYRKEAKDWVNTSKKVLKVSIPTLLISMLGVVFIPSTKEAFIIWGVGGTVDYLKGNPTAKQLPNKCIKALDLWVDSWSNEKKDSIK